MVENIENNANEKELAKDWREFCFTEFRYSILRSNLLSDDFSKSLLQIASIIFAGSVAFAEKISELSFVLKIIFTIGLSLIVISLIFGIVNTQIRQNFWENAVGKSSRRFRYYDDVLKGSKSLTEAEIGAKEAIGGEMKQRSATWAWVTQLTLLSIGIVLMGICFAFKIF